MHSDPEALWGLVVSSGLVDAVRATGLRREFEGLPFPPGTEPNAAAEVAARWLVNRGAITAWQAKRLLRGERGPFFVGDYRLLDRFDCPTPNAFRARHDASGHEACIVVLATKRCVPMVWADIVRRTKAAHAAADPVLVRPLALEKADKLRFIVCEPVAGEPLAEQLAARGPLAPGDAAALTLDVARAVAHLHRLGCVHGGISLDTVRREPPPVNTAGYGGPVRLLQFPFVGDPHVVPPRPALDSTAAIARLGTAAAFIPPESLGGERPSDTRGDVYALGCLLHALLIGAPAGWQGDAARTLERTKAAGPPACSAGIPVELATLVGYMTAGDPARRYPTAVEAADAVAASLGLSAVSPSLPAQRSYFAGGGPDEVETTVADVGELPAIVVAPTTPSGAAPLIAVDTARRAAPATPRRRGRGVAIAGVGALAATLAAAGSVAWWRPFRQPRREAAVRTAGAPATPLRDAAPVAPNVSAIAPPDGAPADARSNRPESPGGSAVPEAVADTTPASARTGVSASPATGAPAAFVLSDAPDLPWAPPGTPGPPPSLAHLPIGAPLILLARPAAFLAADEGRLFVRASGPEVEAGLDALARTCGCPAERIEAVQVAWRPDGAAMSMGVVAWGIEPLPVAADATARTLAWGQRTPTIVAEETIYPGEPFTYWLPRRHGGRALVIGPRPLVDELVAAEQARPGGEADDTDGVEAVLPRDLETLVRGLDGGRHLMLLGSPAWLGQDGSQALAGSLRRLVEPLGRFFGDGVRAAALGLEVGETSYLELDVVAPTDTPARGLAAALGDRISGLAADAERYCNALDPHPFGRRLVVRLPRMLEVVAENLRTGAEGPTAIVNCHLPPHAAHNLALAIELTFAQAPATSAAAAATADPTRPDDGVARRLDRHITLAFARDTLEKSIQLVAEEIGVPIEILGGDLQLEGITKNQSFALDERDKPAEHILRTILARSNPDGKLVYVIQRRDGVETIEITTRAAAAKRGDPLPPGFDLPPTENTDR